MKIIFKTILSLRKYFRCMEYSIEYTLRLAKYIPQVTKIMVNTAEGKSFLIKIKEWCENNIDPPVKKRSSYRRSRRNDDDDDDDDNYYRNKNDDDDDDEDDG